MIKGPEENLSSVNLIRGNYVLIIVRVIKQERMHIFTIRNIKEDLLHLKFRFQFHEKLTIAEA